MATCFVLNIFHLSYLSSFLSSLNIKLTFLYFFLRPAKMCQIYNVALMVKSLEAPDIYHKQQVQAELHWSQDSSLNIFLPPQPYDKVLCILIFWNSLPWGTKYRTKIQVNYIYCSMIDHIHSHFKKTKNSYLPPLILYCVLGLKAESCPK